MSDDTRMALRERIRQSSMDEVTLDEMIRHGFWSEGTDLPSMPAEMIARRGELRREIAELARLADPSRDPERVVREIMQERMVAAKARRIETQERRAAERHARALGWHERQRGDITHVGDASPALVNRLSDTARLATQGLPVFADLADVAQAMGIDIGELRFLAYDRKASTVTHYQRFRVPKKSGGYRTLSAPMPRLKHAQYWLLATILGKIAPHEAAHGFRVGRSILTNAAPHQGKAIVVNFDLEDFFPSIGYRRVKGLFVALGYAEAQAAVFALLATEADRVEMQLDDRRWHVACGERVLPQGAPTSPAITNLLCRRLDRRLAGVARKFGFDYTRYADDLTFSTASSGNGSDEALRRLMWSVGRIVVDEGFTLNGKKTHVMRRGSHQEVTGITVNDGLSVSRRERRRFRAHLHQASEGRAQGAFRRGSPKASALGYARFLTMVQGSAVASLATRAREVYGDEDGATPPASSGRMDGLRAMAALGRTPDGWWRPAAPEHPVPEPPRSRSSSGGNGGPADVSAGRPSGSADDSSTGSRARSARRSSTGAAVSPRTDRSAGAGRSAGGRIASIGAGWQRLEPVLTKIALSAFALSFSIFPFGIIVSVIVLYFLWFHKRRR